MPNIETKGGGLKNKIFVRQDRFNGLLLDGVQLVERAVKGSVGVGEKVDQIRNQPSIRNF
jgi:hypothetical protein